MSSFPSSCQTCIIVSVATSKVFISCTRQFTSIRSVKAGYDASRNLAGPDPLWVCPKTFRPLKHAVFAR